MTTPPDSPDEANGPNGPNGPFRPNYIGHNAEYKRRRAAGNPGWDEAEVIDENLALLERVFAAPGFPTQGRLLELGCGAGDWSLWAAAKGFDVTGIDIAPDAVAWGLEKAGQRELTVDLQVGEVTDLSRFPDASFDVVLDAHCLHCIIGDDRGRMLREAFRVLRPGGLFHVNTMTGDPTAPKLLDHWDPASRCLLYGQIASRYLGLPDHVEAEVVAAGFRVLRRELMPRRHESEFDDLLLDSTRD